jgi:hypothetical protein
MIDKETGIPIPEPELTCKCGRKETKYWIEKYGHCWSCQHEIETKQAREEEKQRAIRDGEGSSEHIIICPWCGYGFEPDGEWNEGGTGIECDECEKEFDLNVDWTPTYTTTKSEEKK